MSFNAPALSPLCIILLFVIVQANNPAKPSNLTSDLSQSGTLSQSSHLTGSNFGLSPSGKLSKSESLRLALGAEIYASIIPGNHSVAAAYCRSNQVELVSPLTLQHIQQQNPNMVPELLRCYPELKWQSSVWILGPNHDADPKNCIVADLASVPIMFMSKPCDGTPTYGLCFGGPVPR
uniref:C-type lectin domain-containing protein n=1 Tax=Spongospora subterranea TaxID=70186 RepID=A0A0H5QHR0_9EUKA|eukprot:CRZ00851.1 hypothetical protein [Spongospora subterranea]